MYITKDTKFVLIINYALVRLSLQDCPEEYSQNGMIVKWGQSPSAVNVESDPLCYTDDYLVKRNCTADGWTPAVNEVGPCSKTVKNFNSTSCPSGFHKISQYNDEYCYRIGEDTSWDYPCFSSGGASIITDLDSDEVNSLIDSLVATNKSRFFWLPAHRSKLFNPVVWSIPGPNWGVTVESKYLRFQNLIWQNCLALDLELRILTTVGCSQVYPSLCFYINNIHYPATCPKGYQAFRYKPDNGTCYGIEKSESELSFEKFLETKCDKPMSDTQMERNRFIFTKIAELSELPMHKWCWYKTSSSNISDENMNFTQDVSQSSKSEGIINKFGVVGLLNASSTLSCMACEKDVIYGETEFMIEYNVIENKIYLTVYFPSGLWKYNNDDKGIQCFSDAKGFVRVVDINDLPFLTTKHTIVNETNCIEKVVYIVDLIAQRSAQYWCEGHTVNFTLISTDKLVVNPIGKENHVFALTLKHYNFSFDHDDTSAINDIMLYLTEAFDVQKILWMDIYDYVADFITILLHIHTTVSNNYEVESLNIQETYNNLKESALLHLPDVNSSYVNLSSSVYCLPTTTVDYITLNWDLTPIGQISAPKQFCLQSNGLPVKRQCLGTYHSGAIWGDVEGRCDSNYFPSETTEYLYNVVKIPENYTSRFLTEGLEFVLSDINIIIPADIYYLSMSLQQVIHKVQVNDTNIDLGDIENMAWAMDRVMKFDWGYLRLAQTLNSTNVILNSVNDIIEFIALQPVNKTDNSSSIPNEISPKKKAYQLAVKPQFVVQIAYPLLTNVTGIAICKTSDTDEFSDMIIRPLYANTSMDEILEMDDIEIATWLPLNLLNTLRLLNESDEGSLGRKDIHVIICVYQNDAVFQELALSNHVVNSRIVGVSIPGVISNLEYPLPIVFRQLNQNRLKPKCGFWNFDVQEASLTSGFWKTQGCFLVKYTLNLTVCECYHLTHFSQLITLPVNEMVINEHELQHKKALNIITLVGCFLSLLGIMGIWVTALVFANWRKKAGTKVLLQLSTAIALPLIFIVIFNLDNSMFVNSNGSYIIEEKMRPLCIVLGSLLHYSILASFMWMLITAILQFVRYVRVLGVSRPSRFMFKFSLLGWGVPIIPVFIVLLIDVDNYVPDKSLSKRICYPKGTLFIHAVLLPICLILFVNVVLFLLVLHSISRGSKEKMKSTDFDLVGAQLRLSVFLIFLLGLTWIFGLFSFHSNLLWSYLFCLTSTFQGFVLFIYFIVCDPATRNMWITFVKPPFTSNSTRNSITSFSS